MTDGADSPDLPPDLQPQLPPELPSELPSELIGFAERLADAARPVVQRLFRSGVAIDDKADATPVTEADREIERILRGMITAAYPDHGILGEEYGPDRTDAAWVWVLDPIDGTKAFITGRPTFGTLIALCRHGRPVLGVIDHGALGDRWVGAPGHGCRLNGRPTAVRAGCRSVAQARFSTTAPEMIDPALLQRLTGAAHIVTYGDDCFQYGLLASGHLDLVVESTMQPYDYCALVPVVQQAGGVITDWAGRALGLGSDGTVLAAASEAVAREARGMMTG